MRWSTLVVVCLGGMAVPVLGAEPEKLPFSKEVLAAWQKEKHQGGWMGQFRYDGIVGHRFNAEEFVAGTEVPLIYHNRKTTLGQFNLLPEPEGPFAMELYLTDKDDKFFAELLGFKRLKRLYITQFPATAGQLATLAEMPRLEALHVHGSKLNDDGMKTLGKLKKLKSLGLRSTQITDTGLLEIAGLPVLEHLELGSNLKITDKSAATLAGMKSLKFLDLHLTALTDEGIKTVAKMDHLRGLYMMNTRVQGEGLKALGALKDLERFHFDGKHITADNLPVVLGMKKLKYLMLDIPFPEKTSAGDAEFKKLAELKDLEELSIFGWQITEASLPVIKGFEKLRFIDLRYTNIPKDAAMQLQKDLPKCRIFLP